MGSSVSDPARHRYEQSKGLAAPLTLYQWRSEMRRKCEASSAPTAFLPVQLADGGNGGPEDTPPDHAPDVPLVEISLRNGRSIRAAANLPAPQLARLIRIVETA
jgi:transposase